VKLAALSPAALTIGCEVRQKYFELSRVAKETIFFTAMDRKAISERLETFSNEKYHIEMQNTPPKQENNIISMAQKTENQPFLPKFYTTFRTTHEHIFLYHRLWYFIQISYLSKFRATLFGISRFCTKCEACFSPTDSR